MKQRLARRRSQLIAQAAQQREALTQQLRDWRRPLEFGDRAWAVARYLKSHPLITLLPLGLFAFRRPRMLLRWFNRGWLAKQVFRKLLIR